jgi:hypothetical protein
MPSASDLSQSTSSPDSDKAREAVANVIEALETWRDEVAAVNERHLKKTLDLVAKSQRSLGWPGQFATATKDCLTEACKIQTHMTSQIVEAWEALEKQAKVAAGSEGLSQAFQFRMPAPSGSFLKDAGWDMARAPELAAMGPLAPFILWMQAAELWQRSWMRAVTGAYERPDRPTTTPTPPKGSS